MLSCAEVAGDFRDEDKTPEPELPSATRPSEHELIRQEVVRLGHRLGLVENRVAALEEERVQGIDRVARQWRYLRRYMAAWLKEDKGATELERMGRQWRRFRKYVAVWLRED